MNPTFRAVGALSCLALAAAPAAATPLTETKKASDHAARELKPLQRVPDLRYARRTVDALQRVERALDTMIRRGRGQLADVGVAAEAKTARYGTSVARPRRSAERAVRDLSRELSRLRQYLYHESRKRADRRDRRLARRWRDAWRAIDRAQRTLNRAIETLRRAVVKAKATTAGRLKQLRRELQETRARRDAVRKRALAEERRQDKLVARWARLSDRFERGLRRRSKMRRLRRIDARMDKLDTTIHAADRTLMKLARDYIAQIKRYVQNKRAIADYTAGAKLWAKQ